MVESAASDDLCTQNSPCTGITRNGLVEFHPWKFCNSVWCGISLTIPMASNGIGNKGIPPSESSGPREQTRQSVLFAHWLPYPHIVVMAESIFSQFGQIQGPFPFPRDQD